MRPLLLAAALLVAAPLFAPPARAQAVGETIDLKGWKIHLSGNDDGTYTCAAMWQFDDKSAVGFAADSAQHTFLIVAQPEAGLAVDKLYEAKFQVDHAKPKTITATATSPVMLVMPVTDPDTDFAALGAGRSVTVEFDGKTYDKPLQGSHDAIRALARCIAGVPTP